jgi:hypothetical protein
VDRSRELTRRTKLSKLQKHRVVWNLELYDELGTEWLSHFSNRGGRNGCNIHDEEEYNDFIFSMFKNTPHFLPLAHAFKNVIKVNPTCYIYHLSPLSGRRNHETKKEEYE